MKTPVIAMPRATGLAGLVGRLPGGGKLASKLGGKTGSNFALYLAFHVARYAFPLVVTPFFARVLMQEGFGKYAVINSCVWTSTVFMEFGFTLYGITRVAAAETREEVSREASAIISGKAALIPLLLVAYFILVWVSGVLASAPAASLLASISALAYGGSFAWYFQGRQRGATAVALEGLPQIAQLLLFLLLIRSPSQLWLVFLIQAMAPVASVLASIWLIRRERTDIRLGVAAARAALTGAAPYFVQRVCFTLYSAINPTMVAMLANVPEAALYSIGDKVGIFLSGIAAPVSQAMMPVVAQTARRDSTAWRTPLLVVGGTMVFCGGLALVVFFTIGYAVDLMFSRGYVAAIPVARMFCVAALFSSLAMALANFVIIPRGAARVLMWSAGAGLVVSLALQVAIVPSLGAMGAAIARAAAEATACVVLGTRVVILYRQSRSSAATPAPQAAT